MLKIMKCKINIQWRKSSKIWHQIIFFPLISNNTVKVRQQPVYWMVLITATIPVIEVMEAILATKIWMVPIVHCHSFCFWPVWIISPEIKGTLILVRLNNFWYCSFPPHYANQEHVSSKRQQKNIRIFGGFHTLSSQCSQWQQINWSWVYMESFS